MPGWAHEDMHADLGTRQYLRRRSELRSVVRCDDSAVWVAGPSASDVTGYVEVRLGRFAASAEG
jgi:hypothetical protein